MQCKSNRLVVALTGLGLLATARPAAAGQASLGASEDASLLGGTDAITNQSLADPGFFVGTDGQGNPKRGLIKFNIAGGMIPAGATITSVQLTLTVAQFAGSGGGSSGGSGGGQSISLFDEDTAWGQPANFAGATSFSGRAHGSTPQTGDATWNDALYNSTPWTIPGGDWSASLTDIADANVTGTLTGFTWSSANMVADVQGWLDDPTTNNGWIIKNADESSPTNFRAFWSAEGATNNNNPAIAPNLLVTYTVVPEPAGALILGAALPALLGRRKRRGRDV